MVTKIDVKLRYGIIIRALTQSYASMVLSTTLSVYTVEWTGPNASPYSNLIALTSAVIMMYVPVMAFSVIHKTSNLKDERFRKRFKTFISDMKLTSPF